MYACMYVYTYVCMYVRTNACMYVRMYIMKGEVSALQCQAPTTNLAPTTLLLSGTWLALAPSSYQALSLVILVTPFSFSFYLERAWVEGWEGRRPLCFPTDACKHGNPSPCSLVCVCVCVGSCVCVCVDVVHEDEGTMTSVVLWFITGHADIHGTLSFTVLPLAAPTWPVCQQVLGHASS
jgi:hypothetical protein